MKYKCPECGKADMAEMEDDKDMLKCPECDHTMSTDKANEMFEDGDMIATVNESELDDMNTKDLSVHSIDEDIAALMSGEDLSEAFADKAKVIFESAVEQRVTQQVAVEREALEEQISEELQDKVDRYLDYVVSKWIDENREAVVESTKREMDEAFMSGLADLFKEHYVSVPEGKSDLVEQLSTQLEEAVSKSSSDIESAIEAKHDLTEAKKAIAFLTVTEGLAETSKEKLLGLSEKFDASIGVTEFSVKLSQLKESYSGVPASLGAEGSDNTEKLKTSISESVQGSSPEDMIAAAAAILTAHS